MNNPNIKTNLEKLPSEKYCATFHINAGFVQSKTLDMLDEHGSNNSITDENTRLEATNEVLNDLIRSAFEEVSLANSITPASAPVIELTAKDVEDEYVFTATFDAVPPVEFSRLSTIDIQIPIVEVTTGDLDATIDAILKQSPTREAALASLGIKETELDAFKSEVLLNLQREALTYESEIKKNAVLTSVCDVFNTTIPDSMISDELDKLQSSQLETGSIALSAPELQLKAKRNVHRRIIVNAVIQDTHLSLHPKDVRQRVEQLAAAYENPEEAVQWYYGNRIELAGVEAKVIEELVVEWLINACNHSTYKISFTQASSMLAQV